VFASRQNRKVGVADHIPRRAHPEGMPMRCVAHQEVLGRSLDAGSRRLPARIGMRENDPHQKFRIDHPAKEVSRWLHQ